MNKIDWARKLTSRKFWAAAVGFITSLLMVAGMTENQIGQIVGLVMSGATLIAYIIGEGLTDAAHIKNSTTIDKKDKE